MKINQIEPRFEGLEKSVDGAMQQIGDLEKRLEQLAVALQEHESVSVDDAHVAKVESPGEPEPDPEPVEDPPTEKVPEDPKTHPDESDTSGRVSPSSNDEVSSQPDPEPVEESEDADARFRPEPEVDDPPMVKVDIQTNLSGPAKLMLEKAVAEKIAELESKSGIKAKIEIN